MITKAKFQNFKALKDVEITFDSPLTVIVGPNGCGKSSVLNGMHWLCDMSNASTFENGKNSALVNLPLTFSGLETAQQCLELWENGRIGILLRLAKLQVFKMGAHAQLGQWECKRLESGVEHDWPQQILKYSCSPVELIKFQAGQLSSPSHTTTTPPPVKPDGSGLASLMGYFKFYDELKYNQIVELFRKVIPNVQNIRINRVKTGGGQSLAEGLIFDLRTNSGVAAAAMSDGTLYILGLIVKILDPQRPKTLLIDDIDHGYHPKAQLKLVDLLHKLLDEIPDLQIIATSHSPYMLDRLKPNEVRMMNLLDDGTAVCGRLEDHPEFERWKDSMSPGEFWNYFGEDWLKELKPTLELTTAP